MKLIKNAVFMVTEKGETKPLRIYQRPHTPQEITEGKEPPYHEATVATVLLNVVYAYQPNPQAGRVLDFKQNRRMSKLLDALELAIESEADMILDDDLVALAKQMVEWNTPYMAGAYRRHSGTLYDMLEKAENAEAKAKAKEA